jgi:hypothetical protein
MRIDAPGGEEIDLHRRCWIGRGGSTPAGCVRVTAPELGYEGDFDLVLPRGTAVFKAGGDLAFHHGGASLQEMIIPVVTVRMDLAHTAGPPSEPVKAGNLPEAVTNRIFSIELRLGGRDQRLDSKPTKVRPLLYANGKQVGAAGMVLDAEFDRASGCLMLEPGKHATVVFMLVDDTISTVRIVVQDPQTDGQLYQSPDIPVRLGV